MLEILELETIDITLVQKKYCEHGALVLRGLQLDTDQFEEVTRHFCTEFTNSSSRYTSYINIGDRLGNLIKKADFYLPLHSESAYCPYPSTPDMGFFLCLNTEQDCGGETFLVDGVEMLCNLPYPLQDRFKNESIIYEYTWEPERWKAQFGVKSLNELVLLLNSLKCIQYDIDEKEFLHVMYTTSALLMLQNGSLAFSNGILAHLPAIDSPLFKGKKVFMKATNQVYWSTMQPLSIEEINQIFSACENIQIYHQWQENDILILDNLRFMHGREMAHSESNRVILSRFGYLK
jgi:alpha-ketoglutarate-dependent taurine dioxygenase